MSLTSPNIAKALDIVKRIALFLEPLLWPQVFFHPTIATIHKT